jgi:hypothetical protein
MPFDIDDGRQVVSICVSIDLVRRSASSRFERGKWTYRTCPKGLGV